MEHHGRQNGYHLEYFNGNQDSFYFDPDSETYLSRQRQPPRVIQCPAKPPETLGTGFRRSSIPETRIVSSKGTVRGFRNRVKVGIATFLENDQSRSKVSSGLRR
ncbi:hypothetical protein CAPTEDRAFT_204052 [Capitella teleta]|uniref:Uncharacterized protein n=1 Tax=Capitella teleta TaxID=283909 RepID=R7VBC5_CAPTE|nr:hypothetical protein CAPTEDRAFT_204052 [Capitella teleta]|eukprot:ELU13611.1 hypothetical protein CAPTEDRAFT_204052 [Capitella teleta]